MSLDTKEKLSPISIVLHWSIAVLFIFLLALGKYMDIAEALSLYPLHKSLGVLILLLVIPRLIWRYRNGLPKPLYEHSLQEKLATAVHLVLLAATLLMPVSGMMMSGFGGYGISIFGLELVVMNVSATDPNEIKAINGALAGIGHTIHGAMQWVVIVTLLVHIGAALKHHISDKDGTLRRMLGAKV